jgi:malonate-semialdehyde dehydrogenase (acetylating) / methylmalonate-semialdehyde dehydrogenase
MRVLHMMQTYNHFIDGKICSGANELFGAVYNPAIGEVIAQVAFANRDTVNTAVAAAKKAQIAWADTSPLNRARVLFKFKQIAEERIDTLIQAVTREHGKVLEDARGEVIRGMEVVEFACGIPQLLKGEFTDQVGRGVDAWSMNQPLGVAVGITPFNFPVMVPMWMWPVAIACGNAFILKPSEKDPGPSLIVASWLQQAGLPDGVFNVVNGDKGTVEHLLTHPDVDAISFVGSTPIAESIYRIGSQHGKRVQALGGAKNHMVVMPDADLDVTANALMGAAYGSAGERCMAISVAVAVGSIGEPLVAALRQKVAGLKIGNGLEPQQDMGPLISDAHRRKVVSYVEKGLSEGALLVLDGRNFRCAEYPKGFYLGPCLFDRVSPTMTIYKEEIFGPVLVVVRVPDLVAALKLVNAHEYGNGTAIFTRDGGIARTFAQDVQVGMVGINVPIPVPMAFHSFGGWKRSLFGANHMHGAEGVRFYTRRKAITARWPDGDRGPEFTMPTHS